MAGLVLLLGFWCVSVASPIEIPGHASVLNVPPSVLGLSLSAASIDPMSPFNVSVTAADANTLFDIVGVRVKITDPLGLVMSSFVWTAEKFQEEKATAGLLIERHCIAPATRIAETGTWVFCVRSPPNQPPGRILVEAEAWDEANLSTIRLVAEVNKFASASLAWDRQGTPQGGEGTILFSYSTNVPIDILARSTQITLYPGGDVLIPGQLSLVPPGREAIRFDYADREAIASRAPGNLVSVPFKLRAPTSFWEAERTTGTIALVLRESLR